MQCPGGSLTSQCGAHRTGALCQLCQVQLRLRLSWSHSLSFQAGFHRSTANGACEVCVHLGLSSAELTPSGAHCSRVQPRVRPLASASSSLCSFCSVSVDALAACFCVICAFCIRLSGILLLYYGALREPDSEGDCTAHRLCSSSAWLLLRGTQPDQSARPASGAAGVRSRNRVAASAHMLVIHLIHLISSGQRFRRQQRTRRPAHSAVSRCCFAALSLTLASVRFAGSI